MVVGYVFYGFVEYVLKASISELYMMDDYRSRWLCKNELKMENSDNIFMINYILMKEV